MKKSELQKFQDFKIKHNLTDTQIVKIMVEYASTVDEYSASFFATKYHISEYVFYKMRDFTIIFMLVTPFNCKNIRDKAFRNQSAKNPACNHTASSNYYKQLILRRKEYLQSFTDEQITLIAIDYSKGFSLSDIARKYKISSYAVQKLLAIALAKHLVCNEVYTKILVRSNNRISMMHHYQGYTVEDLWNYSHWE